MSVIILPPKYPTKIVTISLHLLGDFNACNYFVLILKQNMYFSILFKDLNNILNYDLQVYEKFKS